MASSNSYSWLTPDPFTGAEKPYGNKARVIGEIQYAYKNYFKPIWVPSGIEYYRGNGGFETNPNILYIGGPYPSGDSKAWTSRTLFDTIDPQADGSHLYGYNAALINHYVLNNPSRGLHHTREWMQYLYNQNFGWIDEAASEDSWSIYIGDFEAAAGGYIEPPNDDWIQLLREIPDQRQNFTYDADFSDAAGGSYSEWKETLPNTRPNFAREVKGSAVSSTELDLSTTIEGSVSGTSEGELSSAPINESGAGASSIQAGSTLDIIVPFVKLVDSPLGLDSDRGLPMAVGFVDPNDDISGSKVSPLGIYLHDGVSIRFSVDFSGLPTISSGFQGDIAFAEWSLKAYIVDDTNNPGNYDFEEVFFKFSYFYDGFLGTTETSTPTGRFTSLDVGTLTLYPTVEIPSLSGKWLRRLTLQAFASANVSLDPGPVSIPGITIRAPEVLFD